MKNNTFDTSFIKPENVVMNDDRKQITIIHTEPLYDYCLYNSENTQQATPWINGNQGQIVFNDLNPNIRYAIRIRQAHNDSKPEIIQIDTLPLFDDHNKTVS